MKNKLLRILIILLILIPTAVLIPGNIINDLHYSIPDLISLGAILLSNVLFVALTKHRYSRREKFIISLGGTIIVFLVSASITQYITRLFQLNEVFTLSMGLEVEYYNVIFYSVSCLLVLSVPFFYDSLRRLASRLNISISNSKTNLFVALLLVAILVAIVMDLFDSEFSPHDIIVEYHGLVFDLFIFGVILTVYESRRSKKDKIDRYREEIDDYRFWHSEESLHRIKGLIKRLDKLNVSFIDLSHCQLIEARWFSQYKSMRWIFSGADLTESVFLMVDMQKSKFLVTTLTNATFVEVNLMDCNFGSAKMLGVRFEKCNLNGVDFGSAVVDRLDWIEHLEVNENQGVDFLKENFYVEPFGEHFRVYVNKESSLYKHRSIFGW